MTEQIPVFATNRDAPRMTVADELNRLFRVNREALAQAPAAAIATAYVNAPGFMLLADELEQMPRIRILLGAEPEPDHYLNRDRNEERARRERVSHALHSHEAWLKAERDALGFELKATSDATKLVQWLRAADDAGDPIVEIRRYTGGFLHGKLYMSQHPTHPAYLAGSSNLTYAGLTRNAELNVGANGTHPSVGDVDKWFEECWADSEAFDLAGLYEELWADYSPWTIFLRMLLERYGEHLDDETPGDTRFGLTRFQADGVKRMRRLLNELDGVLVADEVGLGKTYLALEVIAAATEEMRQRVMVIAPAALKASVWDPAVERYDLSRKVTVHSYEEVRNRMDPDDPHHQDFKYKAEDAALVVVDEAHNMRNAGAARAEALDKVILAGANPKKVVLLTATPVNNSLIDLETLIKYFVRDDARFASIGIPSIRDYIRMAQRLDPEALTPGHLFDLMDQVAVRRTRSFVKKNYSGDKIVGPGGKLIPVEFPDAKARRIDYELDEAGNQLVDSMIYALDIPESEEHVASFGVRRDDPKRLLLSRYTPSAYLLTQKLDARQVNNMGLLRSALLKRLESSPIALANTLGVLIKAHEAFLTALSKGTVLTGGALRDYINSDSEELDAILEALDEDSDSQAQPASDFQQDLLRSDVERDLKLLLEIRSLAKQASAGSDPKADMLVQELTKMAKSSKVIHPKGISSGDRRKIIVFSSYADTIRDLHARLSQVLDGADESTPLSEYKSRLAPPVIGQYASGKKGGIHQETRAMVVRNFAPRTAGRLDEQGEPTDQDLYDILLTTDVLAEGVNLQQAGEIINYDLPWNPMRIVQRHGRVDRIGSEHDEIHLGLFFPAANLDEYLNLENTLVRKLKQADAAVGAGEVLPGVEPFPPQDHYDADAIAEEIEQIVNAGGDSAAGSGEEYRRRLSNAFAENHLLQAQLEDLPHNIGSGFVNSGVEENIYVFCMRMGETGQVWFRNVYVDENWSALLDAQGEARVEDDTLKSLIAADPISLATPRLLLPEMYHAAYEAWAFARDHAFAEWKESTDPNNLRAKSPKSFQDASAFVQEHESLLNGVDTRVVVRRLNAVPSNKASRAMRRALKSAATDEERMKLILEVLDQFGIQEAEKVEPLPEIELGEIRLVAWMAVHGGKE